jgi:aspartate kinase
MDRVVDWKAKSGGSSTATPDDYVKLKDFAAPFVKRGKSIAISVSAPAVTVGNPLYTGDREQDRVTKLLEAGANGESLDRLLEIYGSIAGPLRLDFDEAMFRRSVDTGDDFATREAQGERWNAVLLGEYLNSHGLKAKVIHGDEALVVENGYPVSADVERFSGAGVFVVSGYHGRNNRGSIELLGSGGTDITGDFLAAALGVEEYHVLKEVPGILTSDPGPLERFSIHPQLVREMTFHEIRELAYAGARVLQSQAMRQCRATGIPIVVRSLLHDSPGTRIVPRREWDSFDRAYAGITTQPGFTLYTFDRVKQPHYLFSVLEVLAKNRISFDMITTTGRGKGKFQVAVDFNNYRGDSEFKIQVESELERVARNLRTDYNIALVSVVGEGIQNPRPLKAMLERALAQDSIEVKSRFGSLLWGHDVTVIDISLFGMHGQKGYGSKVSGAFRKLDASIDLASTTIDTISFGTSKDVNVDNLVGLIRKEVDVDELVVTRNGVSLGGNRKIRNVSLAVNQDQRHKAVATLHKKLFGE